MPETQSEDPSSTVLTRIERLLVVWDNLIAAGVADSPIAALVHKNIADLSLPRMHADSIISFQNLSRLLEIWIAMRSSTTKETSNNDYLTTFIVEKFVQLRNARSIFRCDETPKSTLQRFEDLRHCVAIKNMVEDKFQSYAIDTWVTNIISLDVDALPVQLSASPDSLRVIEVGESSYRRCLISTMPRSLKLLIQRSRH